MDGNNNTAQYIAIEGVIGVGKTTLARRQPGFRRQLFLESSKRTLFSDFYGDRARTPSKPKSSSSSAATSSNRASPLALSAGSMVISDYTFDKDALFAGINIAGTNDHVPRPRRLAEKIPEPNLVVSARQHRNPHAAHPHRDRP